MANNNADRPMLFHCPNCGASLPVPESTSVQCEYCGSLVLTPPEYLPEKSTQTQDDSPEYPTTVIQIGSPSEVLTQSTKRSITGITLILVSLCTLIGLGAAILAGYGFLVTSKTVSSSIEVITKEEGAFSTEIIEKIPSLIPANETTAPTVPPFASIVLRFGGEGSGPGQFQDPRRIAVDPAGNILIADFNSGRVQKFDPTGKFLHMWTIDASRNQSQHISDLAVDYNDKLYVTRSGDILVFDDNNQEPAARILGYFPDTRYNALAIDPTNHLYALVNAASGDDLVKLNQSGEVIFRSKDIIYSVDPNTPPQNDVIAVDGLGNTYFVSVFEPQIFRYNSAGNYADRLGSPGKEPEQLDHPTRVVVDGSGNLYILDSRAIKILDKNGSFLQSIPWDYSLGSPRDLDLDLEGGLYIVTSQNLVLKYKLSW